MPRYAAKEKSLKRRFVPLRGRFDHNDPMILAQRTRFRRHRAEPRLVGSPVDDRALPPHIAQPFGHDAGHLSDRNMIAQYSVEFSGKCAKLSA
ncbi:MAG: hypothetical protein ABIV36_23505, partial [Sphingobium limneticum]